MATMSTSLAATARMSPVACKDFGPVTGTATTYRFCPPRTLARGHCTDGSTLPGSTGRRTRTGNVDAAIRSAAYPHLCIRQAPRHPPIVGDPWEGRRDLSQHNNFHDR